MEKIKINEVILVEGKYDKIKLQSILDAKILTTNGFSIFNNREKCALLTRIADTVGIIIVTDSDGSGFLIRNKLRGILPKDKIKHLYIPQVSGKETRKNKGSKQGLLGVEGIDSDLLKNLFLNFSNSERSINHPPITKAQFYAAGLSGHPDSKQKRNELSLRLGLPCDMSANALIEALSILGETIPSF